MFASTLFQGGLGKTECSVEHPTETASLRVEVHLSNYSGVLSYWVIVNKLHRKKVVGRWLADHLPTTKDPFVPWWISVYRP